MAESMKTNSGALILPAQTSSSNAPVADIHGIKPPVEIASVWLWIWLGVACVALAVGAYLWWRWSRKKQTLVKLAPVIPPHKRAKEQLTRALDFIHEPYRFCSAVSDTLREYLEERFDLHAPDRTTEEFLAELGTSMVLDAAQKARLETFLNQCDLVKFARAEPVETELRALHSAAVSLIEETEPLAATPAADLPSKP
ncbi:MAG: hypothetical protein JWM99_1911 [Verrucomicrobiales bacterium]|nr:hypothetical protein [Verrucomicrobiales bacterium]